MPNRILRDGILESELVDKLDWPAEVFYRRLMSVVDDFGRFSADPVILRAKCYPRRVDEVTTAQVSGWLVECAAAELIELYEVEGKKYLVFHKLGTPRAKDSRYPAPISHTDEIICMQTQASVPYSNANANAYASSNAKRRGAQQRGALAPGGEPEPTVSRQEGPSREGASAETVTASPSRKGRTAPPVSVSQAVTTEHANAALAAIRQHFPACDRALARDVAKAAIEHYPAITPEELGQLVGLAHRRHMRAPSLFLTTVPEEIERRLIEA